MSRWPSQLLSLFLLACIASGCAHYPLNQRSPTASTGKDYRFDELEREAHNSDRLFLCLTFSGGGTRAAALAYGVLKELRETKITIDGEKRRLIDEIDCISSVSGGSFTAAYYGLYGQRLFTDFRRRFLERDIEGALFRRLLNPVNLVSVASPSYGRTDLAASYYQDELFDGATFSPISTLTAGRSLS